MNASESSELMAPKHFKQPASPNPKSMSPFLVPMLAMLPLLFFAAFGYGGQDFSFHVTAWMELHKAWAAHEWSLGWSSRAQYGFGEPSFCFYPPFSFLAGAALSFLLPLRLLPGAIVWLVLALSGLSMYKASGHFVPKTQQLVAAVLYMFNPYLLVTIVLRFSIAEAWVQALLPITFLMFYRAVEENRMQLSIPLGACLAFGWFTNIPEAIVLFYAFGLLAVILAARTRSARPVFIIALGQLFALALSACRLIPVMAEKGWVSSNALLSYNFSNFMQFKRIPPPHLIVYFCGVYMACGSLIVYLSVRHIETAVKHWSPLKISLVAMSSFSVMMQLPLSSDLWRILPQFKFILFPFRILPLLAFSAVLSLSLDGVSARLRRGFALLLLVLALYPFLAFTRLLPFQRFHSITAAVAQWEHGFEGVLEYVPVTVPPAKAIPGVERTIHEQGPFQGEACQPVMQKDLPNEKDILTRSKTPCSLVLNTFAYPFWNATQDGHIATPLQANSSGLIEVAMPQGEHRLTVQFLPRSLTRSVANGISIAALLLLSLYSVYAMRRRGRNAFPG